MTTEEPIVTDDAFALMDTEPLDALETVVDAWMAENDARRLANAELEGAAWFEATFDRPERRLLQPLDDTVNYAVVVQPVDPWTDELAVEKYWKLPQGYIGSDGVTLQVFDTSDDAAREQAEADRLRLLETHDDRGLDGLMHQVELAAMQNGFLSADRGNPRLFRGGPPDRFETLAQQLRDERNPFWNTDGDNPRTPDTDVSSADPPPAFDRLWHVHDRPVETPDGTSRGHALYLTYYPDIHQDQFADGSFSDADYPTHAKTLEMARFETAAQAQTFGKEFERYIVPGVLDPPELAEEVAKLEVLPVEWKDMDSREIGAVMGAAGKVMREARELGLHNPNAELEVEKQVEQPLNDLDI
ncbi:MAG: hypothetical protein SF123_00230 [Chloroflexota bacterium]|nr:hypothetical protein [Chloroflexota bacterium]